MFRFRLILSVTVHSFLRLLLIYTCLSVVRVDVCIAYVIMFLGMCACIFAHSKLLYNNNFRMINFSSSFIQASDWHYQSAGSVQGSHYTRFFLWHQTLCMYQSMAVV